MILADNWALHERILHVHPLFVSFCSRLFILVQTIQYLLDLHVDFIDILNSRVNFAGWARLETIWGVVFSFYLGFRSWLWLNFHGIFYLAEFLHEIRILLAVVTEPRNMLWFFPSTPILGVLLGVQIAVVGFISFDDIRWCHWISQGISVGCIRVVSWRFR